MAPSRRILVIANETCAGEAVVDEVVYRAGSGAASVLVVAPALVNSRMGHWLTSNQSQARAEAEERLSASVTALRERGLDVSGQLGDSDPLQALDDAYRVFTPDEIVISTHPPTRSNWLERKVVVKARERYQVPVTHVVVDLVHEAAVTDDDPRPARRMAERMLTLYRAVDYDEALAVADRGFRNEREVVPGRSGVIFTEEIPHAGGLDDPTVFVVEVPESTAALYRLETEGERRAFLLPAEFVNRHHPRALVTEWSE